MSDVPVGATEVPSTHRRGAGVIRTLLGPLWVTTFRDPVRTGRLRLDGLSFAERQLARAGLVMLVLLLVSMLFGDVWRHGTLLPQGLQDDPRFVPEALVPVAMAAAFLAFVMVVWGALDAAPSVRLLVAAGYALTASTLMRSTIIQQDDTWLLRHGQTVLYVAFATPFGALVLSALLHPLVRRSARLRRATTAVLRVVCLAGFVTMPVVHLVLAHQAAERGFQGNAQTLLLSAFTNIENLLLALVFLTAVAIVDFATDVSTSLAEPMRSTPRRWWGLLRWGLLALVLVKLWFVVGHHADYWRTLVTYQPETLARTSAVLALLAGLAAWVHRVLPPGPEAVVDEVKERLTILSTVVLVAAAFVLVLLVGLGILVAVVGNSDWAVRLAGHYPLARANEIALLVVSVGAVALGWRLAHRRTSSPRAREVGSGLLLMGAWNAPAWAVQLLGLRFGFSFQTIDLAVTLAVLGWLVVRWRRVDAAHASLLLAVAVFSWLVLSRGDYLSFLGGLLHLPAVVVVVFGILYTMLSGSGFTAESSRRLPRESRTLMFVGYLLLSVTILTWQVIIHQESAISGEAGFYYLGLPIAAWLLVRRIVPRQLGAVRAVDPAAA